MAIGTVEFELSMRNHETNEYLVAHAYTVDGVTNADGSPRELSIGQLVMAICLQRAAELEADIIRLMDDMSKASIRLECLTKIEQDIVDANPSTVDLNGRSVDYDGTSYTYKNFLTQVMGLSNVPDSAGTSSDIVSEIENSMDNLNSFSQQTMIELQSLTSKRDQSYDMISNILKSLNNVLVGNANNM